MNVITTEGKLPNERESEKEMKGELNRTILVYVDSYQNSVPAGRYFIASGTEMISFHSLSQLLLGINHNLDEEKFPQSFCELRSFHDPLKKENLCGNPLTSKKGVLATFSIRILFRQNASWQGVVTWIEGDQEEYFRSVLELVTLIDNALGYTMKPE